LCGGTGSDSAGVVGAGAAEEEAERKFGLKVYLAVLRQPVVLGYLCASVPGALLLSQPYYYDCALLTAELSPPLILISPRPCSCTLLAGDPARV
jgi:hypothetical protein